MKYFYASVFLGAGSLMIAYVVYSFKQGEIYVGKGRGTIYWRATNPLGFWFSAAMFTLVGLGALAMAGYALFGHLRPL